MTQVTSVRQMSNQPEETMRKYRAIIYGIDVTILNTLNRNMNPSIKIIKEETNEKWIFDQILKFAVHQGMKG